HRGERAMFWQNRLFSRPKTGLRICLLTALLPSVICLSTAISTAEQLTVFDDIKDLLKQAQREGRKGRTAEAEKLYRQIIEADPRNSDAKLALAYLLVKQRRIREAYEFSFDVAKAEPKNPRAFAVLGATFLTAGRFSEARRCFVTAIQISRKEDLAWAG